MKKTCVVFLYFICLICLSSCNSDENNKLETGIWKAELFTAGGSLPFFFEITKNENGKYSAELLNGEETVKIDDVQVNNDSLVLYLPAYNSTINAEIEGIELNGTLTLVKANAVLQVIPLKTKKEENFLFFFKPKDSINITGKWAVKFTEDDGSSYPAVGEFIQSGADVNGTFLTTTGDYRFLSGQVNDSSIYLATFDGAHAYLFKAKMDNKGNLNGGYWSGLKYHETWTAYKDINAKLPDADSLTSLKRGASKFDFTFPDLKGDFVSLSDTKYKNKVVIVTLAGSWCPNCHDEARFLSPFYDKYKDEGVEIIGLMYENYPDSTKAIEQIKKFKKKFNIKYDLLLAGVNNKDFASKTLPQLNRVLAFPTTIFVDKQRRVRRINTGFSGPGTGEHYIHLTDEITELVEELLNENQNKK